jgi:hypothetical protein
MRILPSVRKARFPAIFGIVAMSLIVYGCPSSSQKTTRPTKDTEPAPAAAPAAKEAATPKTEKPSSEGGPAAKAKSPETELTEEIEEIQEKPRDLGQPLVEHPENLHHLDPDQPLWIDRVSRHVVLLGEVCRAGYPLEFFATYSTKSYEAVVAVNVTPSKVHAALLLAGAEAGHPVQFQPEFVPPSGTEIAIEVRWKDASGKVQSSPAQDWVRNIQTKKALETNWVFGGSILTADEGSGKPHYLADSGDFICLLNLPTAMLDLPIRSYARLEARLFEAFEEHLPPAGTPTTLVLKPILPAKPGEAARPVEPSPDAKPGEKNVLRDEQPPVQ